MSEVVPLNEYSSFVDGKDIRTRVSPSFVEAGGIWSYGDKAKFILQEAIDKAKLEVERKYKGEWKIVGISMSSLNLEKNLWYTVLLFGQDDGDFVSVILNMKGEIWPLGKRYSVWDNYKKPD